jgi:N-methylhydantoinase B
MKTDEQSDSQIGEQLNIVDESIMACSFCEEPLGSISENFKRNLAIEEVDIEEAGPHYVDPSRYVNADMVFRKFYCPGCGTMLFTETAQDGDSVVNEFEIAAEGES